MPNIRLNNIHKYFGNNHVLNGISFDVKSGEFISIIGESGCGKTTLLKIISGLLKPEFGEIYFDDEIFNFKDASKRNVGFIFQDYTLYPNLTVFDNVLFSLKKEKESYETKMQMVYRILDTLGIRNLESAFPKELSFGQQQKVSIAKNLIKNPSILLFDEPLSNIDEKKRFEFRRLLKEIKEFLPKTTFIYVSHNFYDCINLTDRVIYIKDGKIKYSGDIQLLYRFPIDNDSILLTHSEAIKIDGIINGNEVCTDNLSFKLDELESSLIEGFDKKKVDIYYEGNWFALFDGEKPLFNMNNEFITDASILSDKIVISNKYKIDKSNISNRLINDNIRYVRINLAFFKKEKNEEIIEFDLNLLKNDGIYQLYELLNKKILLRNEKALTKIYYPISKLEFLDNNYKKISTSYEFSPSQKDFNKNNYDVKITKTKGYKKYIAINYETMDDYNFIYYFPKNYDDYVAIKTDLDVSENKIIYVKNK